MISKLLGRAAKLVARKGRWIKGNWARSVKTGATWSSGRSVPEEDGAYCAVGAIQQAGAQLGLTTSEAVKFANSVVRKRVKGFVSIMHFNDAASTTQEQVVKMLRGAACEARKAGK